MDIKEIQLSHRDDGYVAVVGNRAFKINQAFYDLFILMKAGKSLEEAAAIVSKQLDMLKEDVENRYKEFVEHVSCKTKGRSSYIRGNITLLNESCVRKISSVFHIFFEKKFFYPLVLLSSVVNVLYYFYVIRNVDNSSFDWSVWQIIVLFLLCQVSTMFHEIGHSAASRHYNQDAGHIGFGFYIVFPVLYADVTKIWLLPNKQRMIVNAGGIYFQMLINVLLCVLYLTVNDQFFKNSILYLSISNSIVIMTSLLPFFRNDGYWILSDFLNVDNLLAISDDWFVSTVTFRKTKKTDVTIPIKIFGILNWIFRIYILEKLCYASYRNFHDMLLIHNDTWLFIKTLMIFLFGVIGAILMLKMIIYKLLRYETGKK